MGDHQSLCVELDSIIFLNEDDMCLYEIKDDVVLIEDGRIMIDPLTRGLNS